MNKLLLNNGKIVDDAKLLEQKNIIIKEDSNIYLELNDYLNDINITVNDNISCHVKILGSNVNTNLNIILNENSNLRVDSLIFNGNNNVRISLSGRGAVLEFIYSTVISKDSKVKFTVLHEESDTKSSLINNGLVLDNHKLIFDVNGVVNKESSRCVCLQDNKIITDYANLSRVLPNLFIDNYDVEAEHSAYIGSFSSDDMFYLMSRGIDEDKARLLLIQSFLVGKMLLSMEETDKFISKINNI